MREPSGTDDESAREARAILLLQQHDHTALDFLLPKYAEGLRNLLICKLSLSAEDAEEIVQDTFVKALKVGDRYNPNQSRIFTWLFSIANYKALTLLKQRSRYATVPLSVVEHNLYEEENEARSSLVEQPSEEMQQVLQKLTPVRGVVTHLYYYGGYSTDVIAELLNISETTVRSYMSRAHNDIKKHLG